MRTATVTAPAKLTAVFAVIYGFDRQPGNEPAILLIRRKKEKRWQLPGGETIEEMSVLDALKRGVTDSCGLEISVPLGPTPFPLRPVGPPQENDLNVVQAYRCFVGGGQLRQNDPAGEFDRARFCTYAEIAAGCYSSSERGVESTYPIKLVGPRTTIMVLDGISLKQKPIIGLPPYEDPHFADLAAHLENLLPDHPTAVGDHFYQPAPNRDDEAVLCWPRLKIEKK